jgi:predicted nucleic acid-binding protein
MLVADTSALVSLAAIDLVDDLLAEYDVHTTETVREELGETAEYDDRHGDAAAAVLDRADELTLHRAEESFESSRVGAGEGGCAVLTREIDAEFLLTDDLRALPELQTLADARVAISPIVLRALVQHGVLEPESARERLDELTEQRDWLGAPIYRRGKELLE